FSRKRVSRNLFQNSRDFNPDSLPLCAAGTTRTHQTNLSGKCAQLGFSQICGKTGSVGSDLQFLGTTSSHQDKGENSREKPPVQLTPALVRSPSCRRGLNGTKPVPPIPRGISLLPDKADLSTVGHKKKEPDDIWKCEKDSLPIDLSELNFKDKDLDQEE
ncbi:TOGARAM1 isoform 7, partial [Pongo abelii]